MTADLDGGGETNASISVKRGDVLLAVGDSRSKDSDVTVFTVTSAPRVSNQPVVTFVAGSVTNEGDGVVNVDVDGVIAAREHT